MFKTIIECCKTLNASLEPVKKLMPPQYTWQDLINKAYSMGIDLSARYWIYPDTTTPMAYNVYGAALSEAIVDVLTGEIQILRTDILYDCGQSLNGEIDVGQAEGAFVMGEKLNLIRFFIFLFYFMDSLLKKALGFGSWRK